MAILVRASHLWTKQQLPNRAALESAAPMSRDQVQTAIVQSPRVNHLQKQQRLLMMWSPILYIYILERFTHMISLDLWLTLQQLAMFTKFAVSVGCLAQVSFFVGPGDLLLWPLEKNSNTDSNGRNDRTIRKPTLRKKWRTKTTHLLPCLLFRFFSKLFYCIYFTGESADNLANLSMISRAMVWICLDVFSMCKLQNLIDQTGSQSCSDDILYI